MSNQFNQIYFKDIDKYASLKKENLPSLYIVSDNTKFNSLKNLNKKIYDELNSLNLKQISNKKIAITASSRGITDLKLITKTVVDFFKMKGAIPFLIPSMGSHGGANSKGQLKVLEDTNSMTEKTIGCKIKSSMQTEIVARLKDNTPIYQDKFSVKADGVFLINRIKSHTGFSGKVESGLCKMLVIRLGKQQGASQLHSRSFNQDMGDEIINFGREILNSNKTNIIGGLGIIENPDSSINSIKSVDTTNYDDFILQESKLLKKSIKLLPKIPFKYIDALIINKIGKNISGSGMDKNVVGLKNKYIDIRLIYLKDITGPSNGNALGLGFADICNKNIIDKINFNTTYINAFTSKKTDVCKIPIVLRNDFDALKFISKFCKNRNSKDMKIVFIDNTLSFNKFFVTKSLLNELDPARYEFKKNGDAINLEFDQFNNFKNLFCDG